MTTNYKQILKRVIKGRTEELLTNFGYNGYVAKEPEIKPIEYANATKFVTTCTSKPIKLGDIKPSDILYVEGFASYTVVITNIYDKDNKLIYNYKELV